MNFDNKFLNEVINSYKKVLLSNGTGRSFNRSPKKVDSIHKCIADDLNYLFINDEYNKYIAVTKETSNKEEIIQGRYYNKRADVTILDISKNVERVVAVIELKFILSSLYKNISNYFEQSMGECVNIKMSGYKYYDVNIYLSNTPNYSKGIITGIDKISLKRFQNYVNRSNGDSYLDPNNLTIPDKSLFIVMKNLEPLKNEEKDIYIKKELNLLENVNLSKIYDSALETHNWGINTFINEYSDFINEIKKSITKGE